MHYSNLAAEIKHSIGTLARHLPTHTALLQPRYVFASDFESTEQGWARLIFTFAVNEKKLKHRDYEYFFVKIKLLLEFFGNFLPKKKLEFFKLI